MSPEATRPCPDCGAPNPLDAETCAECNHPMNPFARRVEAPAGLRPRPERPEAPTSGLPGAPTVREEQGKVIPRRRHGRAGLFGIGSEDRPTGTGDAPAWIWAAVGAVALVVALVTAIGITAGRPKVTLEGGTSAQLVSADSLARILRKTPDDPKANAELGNLYYDTKNFAEAIPYYDRALAGDTSLVDVAVDRAVAHYQAGHPDQAIAQLESLMVRHPNHGVAAFDVGVIYEFQGKTADAARAYRLAVERAATPELKHVAAMRLQALEHPGTMPGPVPPGNP